MIVLVSWVAASSLTLAEGWYCGSCGLNGLVLMKTVRQPVSDCCLLSFSAARLQNSAKAADNSEYCVKRRLKLREQTICCLLGAFSSRSRQGMPFSSSTVLATTIVNRVCRRWPGCIA